MNVSHTSPSAAENDSVLRGIDASCRPPLMLLFAGAAVWLVISAVFALIASIKFHSPTFLANSAWLTYGRVYPVSTNALMYGFCIPAGLAVGLWILARLGRAAVVQPWAIAFGAMLWHFGVFIGIIEILAGNSTGYEGLEMPKSAATLLFLGYMLIGIWSVLTLHARSQSTLQPSQWFLLAALFWFPWIFSTAHLLLTVFPVRGITQSVVAWWFAGNLRYVWLGLVGLAAVFYLIPVLMNRTLYSHYLALFTFWTIILFASWTGIPNSAPVPAWMPAMSTVATVLTLVTILTVVVNVYRTVGYGCSQSENPPPGKFIAFGVMAFVLAWFMNVVGVLRELSPFLQFTWFTVAQYELNVYGFFTLTMIGAGYYILPRVTGVDWKCRNKIRANFWLAVAGIVLYAGPLLVGGVIQGIKLQNPEVPFNAIMKSGLMPLRVSSIGQVLILAANALFLWNVGVMFARFARTQLLPVETPAGLKTAEVKS